MALDGETTEQLEGLTTGDDTLEGADTVAANDEITITIEGEQPQEDAEPQEPEAQKSWVNKLRRDREEALRKTRELERRLAEIEAAKQAEAEPQDPGPMPKIADVGFDDEAHEKALAKWIEDTAAYKDVKSKHEAKAKAERDRWAGLHTSYVEKQKALGVPDYKAAEDAVVATLSVGQQNAILEVIADPAAFVYALGKNPAKAEELAKLGDTARFVAEIARLEGKVKLERKSPPPPESRLPGTSAGGGGSLAARLSAAQKAAEISGDYDEVYKVKREMRAAGLKV